MSWYKYPRYVSVAEKKAKAMKKLAQLKKKNPNINPVVIESNVLAKTWWGKSWNTNLESYSDYHNRIGRGRSYVRHGAVLDLQILAGKVKALVQGAATKPYSVIIPIRKLSLDKVNAIKMECRGKLNSLQDLISGKFPKELGQMFLSQGNGLFPEPDDISLSCSCPDSAIMCKHVAATLYGVGARLDEDPLLFFKLRSINVDDLVTSAIKERTEDLLEKTEVKSSKIIEDGDLSDIFGIDLDDSLDIEQTNPIKKKRGLNKKAAAKPKKKAAGETSSAKKVIGKVKKGRSRPVKLTEIPKKRAELSQSVEIKDDNDHNMPKKIAKEEIVKVEHPDSVEDIIAKWKAKITANDNPEVQVNKSKPVMQSLKIKKSSTLVGKKVIARNASTKKKIDGKTSPVKSSPAKSSPAKKVIAKTTKKVRSAPVKKQETIKKTAGKRNVKVEHPESVDEIIAKWKAKIAANNDFEVQVKTNKLLKPLLKVNKPSVPVRKKVAAPAGSSKKKPIRKASAVKEVIAKTEKESSLTVKQQEVPKKITKASQCTDKVVDSSKLKANKSKAKKDIEIETFDSSTDLVEKWKMNIAAKNKLKKSKSPKTSVIIRKAVDKSKVNDVANTDSSNKKTKGTARPDLDKKLTVKPEQHVGEVDGNNVNAECPESLLDILERWKKKITVNNNL
ncbi:MAG: SWIM zinc finger family protein [Desulfobulbaceae bacterium]|nr:SWIM zinc finger family protein [Desulfobulbaceae bacterium]